MSMYFWQFWYTSCVSLRVSPRWSVICLLLHSNPHLKYHKSFQSQLSHWLLCYLWLVLHMTACKLSCQCSWQQSRLWLVGSVSVLLYLDYMSLYTKLNPALRTDHHLNLWCTCILSDAPLNCELQLYIYHLARLGTHVGNNLLIRPHWWAKSPNYKRQISLDWVALASHNCMHNTFTVHSIVYSTNPVIIDTWCAA